MSKTRMLDSFSGTRADLLKLLRDLHDGTVTLAHATRLQALDAVCDVLADPSRDVADTILAGRLTARLVGAIVHDSKRNGAAS